MTMTSMTIRTRRLGRAAIFLALLSLAACSNDDEPATVPDPEQHEEEHEDEPGDEHVEEGGRIELGEPLSGTPASLSRRWARAKSSEKSRARRCLVRSSSTLRA